MVTSIIHISKDANNTIGMIKAVYGLGNKDEAIEKLCELARKQDKRLEGRWNEK